MSTTKPLTFDEFVKAAWPLAIPNDCTALNDDSDCLDRIVWPEKPNLCASCAKYEELCGVYEEFRSIAHD